MKIILIDYGIGNVKSIINAFDKQKIKVVLSREKELILNADGLILPGVGAFSQGMDNLKKYNLISIIEDYVKTGKPLLGICLGMQLLFEKSEEFGETKGLGLIEGDVLKIPIDNSQKIKLPHVSWNEIKPKNIDWENTILENIEVGENMYFVHTFAGTPKNKNEIFRR